MTGAERLYNVRFNYNKQQQLPSLPFLLTLVLVSRHFLLWRTATVRSMASGSRINMMECGSRYGT